MNEIIKVFGKVILQMIAWVFVLSISWEGRTLFDRVHSVIIENPVVEAIDSEIADVWYKVSETAKVTFSDASESSKEAM